MHTWTFGLNTATVTKHFSYTHEHSF